jgi:hypothetical protein
MAIATGLTVPQRGRLIGERHRDLPPADHSLSARELTELFVGKRHAAFATATDGCEPRLAPIDIIMLRARFYFGNEPQRREDSPSAPTVLLSA